MAKTINLLNEIETRLPAELTHFMRLAGEVSSQQGKELYLVGGVVRDLILGRPNLDLDLVVEGNAIELANKVAEVRGGKIVTHSRFNTAKIKWNSWSTDFATARSETYDRPGALPKVKSGSIRDDLFRRDFTINAMAVYLSPRRYGEIIDLYGGMNDLENKLIRVLHDKSFTDDATRIWRALRYEQRLDFQLEPRTRELLKRDINMLDTISGDRIRHELELVFKEQLPEKVLHRAEELGVLAKLHPVLRGNGWLGEKFQQARILSMPDSPQVALYLALFTYHLSSKQIEEFLSYLRFPNSVARVIRYVSSIKDTLKSLSDPDLTPSRIYRLLHGYSSLSITANLMATDSAVAREHIKLYLDRLRYVKSALTGEDLIKLGVTRGPRIKEILGMLLDTRLDGRVKSKSEEEDLVRGAITE